MLKSFYYQLKGKKGNEEGYGWGNWTFPPIYSGKVTAKDKKEAKILIEEEYNKKFPLRVLNKDLEHNEFLLKITDMDKEIYLKRLFEDLVCVQCNKIFRRIDLYNDSNVKYKGTEYCSDDCKDKAYEQRRFEISESMFNESGNVPVIYKISNKESGMCYVGQTIQSFTLRWWQHIKWGQSDCKFHNAIKNSKLTDWIFEVIFVCSSKEELNEKESYFIRKFDSINKGYNTAKIGNYPEKEQSTIAEVIQCDLSQNNKKEVRHSSH